MGLVFVLQNLVAKERYEVACKELCIAVHKSGSLGVFGLPTLNLKHVQ